MIEFSKRFFPARKIKNSLSDQEQVYGLKVICKIRFNKVKNK